MNPQNPLLDSARYAVKSSKLNLIIGGQKAVCKIPAAMLAQAPRTGDWGERQRFFVTMANEMVDVTISAPADVEGVKNGLPVKTILRARLGHVVEDAMREVKNPSPAPMLLPPADYVSPFPLTLTAGDAPPAELAGKLAEFAAESSAADTVPQDNGDSSIQSSPAESSPPVVQESPAADIVPPAVRRRGRTTVGANGQS